MESESDGDQGPRQSSHAPGKRTAHHGVKSPMKRKKRSKPLEVEEVVSSSQGSAETSDTPDDYVTQTNKSFQERAPDKWRSAPSGRSKVTKVDSFEYDSMESNDSILQEANVTSSKILFPVLLVQIYRKFVLKKIPTKLEVELSFSQVYQIDRDGSNVSQCYFQ